MSGFALISKIRSLEVICDGLGLQLAPPDVAHSVPGMADYVSVMPKDQTSLPLYSRDAMLFVGTIDQLDYWLRGILWARRYDQMLMPKDNDHKRKRREQDLINNQLLNVLKTGAVDNTNQSQ